MTSEVLRTHEEATYITVETASFYGVKQKPSRVLVNSQDATFTYRANQVRLGGESEVNRQTQTIQNKVVNVPGDDHMHQNKITIII